LKFSGELPKTSDGFELCTQSITAYVASLPPGVGKVDGQRLVLVDTPGFDDTSVSDSEILRRICAWLASSCVSPKVIQKSPLTVLSSFNSRVKVGGVIYMFPIYPNRITRNDKANPKVLQELCGKDTLAKVRMVTTKWSLCTDETVGARREDHLKSNFWKDMVEGGCQLSRLDDRQDSAANLLRDVLKDAVAMDLQKEILVQSRLPLRTMPLKGSTTLASKIRGTDIAVL
jgi:hypothetical protein